MKRRLKYVLLLLVLLAGCHSDQYTKRLATRSLRYRPPVVLLAGFADLCYAENAGVAFSLLDGLMPPARRVLLVAMPLVMMAVVACFLWRLRSKPLPALLPFTLVLSGAVGNLLDRLRCGCVIDFIHVHVGELFHWPVFNVADALLFAGGAMLVLQHILARGEPSGPAAIGKQPFH